MDSTAIALPDAWSGALPALAAGEHLVAWLEIDLDDRLSFRSGLIALTNRRILTDGSRVPTPQTWPLTAALTLHHHDHAGVGTLELADGERCLARWRYTLGRNAAALRFEREFNRQRDNVASDQPPPPLTAANCPICQAPLPPDEEECPNPRPGRCCACGNLPNPTRPCCWRAFC
jgi:ATP-binding cassette subfamily B protein